MISNWLGLSPYFCSGLAFVFRFLDAYRPTGSFPRPRIRLRPLTANRKAPAMPDSAITVDCLKALQIRLKLTAKIAFDQHPGVADRLHNRVDLFGAQIFRADVRRDVRNFQHSAGGGGPKPIDVLQADRNPLVVRDVNTKETWHTFLNQWSKQTMRGRHLALALLVTGVGADDAEHIAPLHNAALLTQAFNGGSDFHGLV
jgi:hypothetical protein